MSRPAGIEHILVDNPENYRRTPASIRMVRPLLGNGLLLSDGEDWRQQRRTLAPAREPKHNRQPRMIAQAGFGR
jgi:cytochrome P450